MLAVVPVMLQRILADDASDARDTSSLRIVACSGSALPATVATAWMDRFGENLYNVYGSTEAGQATLATPTTCGPHREPQGGSLRGRWSRWSTVTATPYPSARPD